MSSAAEFPTTGRELVAHAVAMFVKSEVTPVLPAAGHKADTMLAVRVAAVGTTAGRALRSPMLDRALSDYALTATSKHAYPDAAQLASDAANWDLGVVLSPFKQDVMRQVNAASSSAAQAGVADTLVSIVGQLVGVNTNSWAVAAALSRLVPSDGPRTVLLLGAGASARSTVLGIRRTWPCARIVCSARSAAAGAQIAALADGATATPEDAADVHADVVVNATTWGETAESEERPFAFPFHALLGPGRVFFDLNNRRSALVEQALDAACVVMSGTLMQVVTHSCRAALAAHVSQPSVRAAQLQGGDA